jgi:hypothetical protein
MRRRASSSEVQASKSASTELANVAEARPAATKNNRLRRSSMVSQESPRMSFAATRDAGTYRCRHYAWCRYQPGRQRPFPLPMRVRSGIDPELPLAKGSFEACQYALEPDGTNNMSTIGKGHFIHAYPCTSSIQNNA